MHIRVRKASAKDFETIVDNWVKLVDFYIPLDSRYYRYKEDRVKRYRRFLRRQMRSKKSVVLVAERDGKFAGHMMASEAALPPIYVVDNEAYVNELMVKEGFRRRGVGTALLKAAEKWAKRKKLSYLSLTSHVKNPPATKAYLKCGFRKNYVKMYKIVR